MTMPPASSRELRYWDALRSVDPERSRAATYVLSTLLCRRGERGGGEKLLRDSIKRHGPGGVAETWFRLGRLLEEESRIAEAETAFAQALRFASVEETPGVLMDLAARSAGLEELERAADLYGLVAERGPQPRLRALASYRLGRIQIGLELQEEALQALRRSLAEADPTLEPFVLVVLAALMEERGEQAEAADLLQRAIAGDHHDQAPRAALALARLRSSEGDGLEAYRLYQLVVESEHPEVVALAETEKAHLVESELDSLLVPTWAPTYRRSLRFDSSAIGALLRSSGTRSKSKAFSVLDGGVAHIQLPRLTFRQCSASSLLLPIAQHSCEMPERVAVPRSNLIVLDAEAHRFAQNECGRPAPASSSLNAWIAELLGDEPDEVLAICRLLYSYIAASRTGNAFSRWSLLRGSLLQDPSRDACDCHCADDPPDDKANRWLRPLLTEMTHRRIAGQVDRCLTLTSPEDDGDAPLRDKLCPMGAG